MMTALSPYLDPFKSGIGSSQFHRGIGRSYRLFVHFFLAYVNDRNVQLKDFIEHNSHTKHYIILFIYQLT